MNHTKWVLQRYPVNAYGMRDGLIEDMLVSSQRNLVNIWLSSVKFVHFCIPNMEVEVTVATNEITLVISLCKLCQVGVLFFVEIILSPIKNDS